MRRGFLLFKPDDGNGGSDGTPPADPPAGTPAPPAGDPPAAGKTFTQAELDAIVQKEKSKAEKSAREAAAAEANKSKMDETERLKLEKQEAEQKASDAITGANARLLRAEARVQAVTLGIAPERVEYALRLADLSGIEVGNDGVVPAEEVKKAIAVVLTDIPELKGAGGQSGSQRSGGDFQGGGDQKRIWTRAELAALVGTPEFEKHKDDINAAAVEGRIRG